MKSKVLISVLSLALAACSSGGGGSAATPTTSPTSPKATLSYSSSTVTASKSYMKDQDSITLTVAPKSSNGAAYDIAGEWTITVFTLCYGCSGTQTPTIYHNDFSKVGDVYQITFTAPASAKVDFLLRFDKTDNSAAMDSGNVPKLTLNKYTLCDEPVPTGELLRTAEIDGVEYRLLCNMEDIERMSVARASDNKWYTLKVVDQWGNKDTFEVTGAELAKYQELTTQNFYVMQDIIAPDDYSLYMSTPGGGVDMSVFSGIAMSYGMQFSGTIKGNNHQVDASLLRYISGATIEDVNIKSLYEYGMFTIEVGPIGATFKNVNLTSRSGNIQIISMSCSKVNLTNVNLSCVQY